MLSTAIARLLSDRYFTFKLFIGAEMIQRICFLDKDGTLVSPASGQTFVQSPTDQILLPGAKEQCQRLKAEGWELLIISNQGGCSAINPTTGQPYKTVEDAIAEMRFCLELLPEVTEAYFCPDFAGQYCWRVWDDCSEECRICYENEIVLVPHGFDALTIDGYKDQVSPEKNFRKPGPGMINLAIEIYQPEQTSLFLVGDRDEDEGAAQAANIRFVHASQFLQTGLDACPS